MKRRLIELTLLLIVLGLIGVFVLVSGIAPVNASGGHWPITRWFLDYASDRSIDFHSSGIAAPPLDRPGMLRLGAAAYDSNCRWCHGRPGRPAPVVAANMTPTPPYLPEHPLDKQPRELFYVVKHGIKFAGMPAWPAQQRDDEIWPLVAFLQQLPATDAATYDRYIQVNEDTEDAAGRLAAERCAACHGSLNQSAAGAQVPAIAGQSKDYLLQTLAAYRLGTRVSGIMQPIAARLEESQVAALADHYAQADRPAVATADKADGGQETIAKPLIEQGRELAQRGDGANKIAACAACHTVGGKQHNPAYPQLDGLSPWYISNQLKLFAVGARGGTKQANLMHPIAEKLSDVQIEALAAFYSQNTSSH